MASEISAWVNSTENGAPFGFSKRVFVSVPLGEPNSKYVNSGTPAVNGFPAPRRFKTLNRCRIADPRLVSSSASRISVCGESPASGATIDSRWDITTIILSYMESSRDSSIWRSLAVAFGDGVAFGVGMKLTQNAGRPAGAPARSEPGPLAGRIEEIEQRIARVEQACAVSAGAGPAPFDHKVLEAVAHSLDARLMEHAGKVERSLAELEARLALKLESLHQRDNSIASGAQARVEEACARFNEQATALGARMEQDVAALRDHVVSLHEEIRQERAEISQLRDQLSGSNRAMLDLVLAIGQACRQAAGGTEVAFGRREFLTTPEESNDTHPAR